MDDTFVIKGSVRVDEHYRNCFTDMNRCMATDGSEFDDFTRLCAARLFALASMFPELTGHQLRKIATERWSYSKTNPDRFIDHDVSVLTFAKETARGGSAQIGSSVEVSRVQLPSKKAKLLFYLNCVEAQVIMPTSENIAEFEAIGDEGGE